eukprot:6369394-Amphidinium_carterae.1
MPSCGQYRQYDVVAQVLLCGIGGKTLFKVRGNSLATEVPNHAPTPAQQIKSQSAILVGKQTKMSSTKAFRTIDG